MYIEGQQKKQDALEAWIRVEQVPERPLGMLSDYVCGGLYHDMKAIRVGERSLEEFEQWTINPLLEMISDDAIERVLDATNSHERRVALLDLFLLQQIVSMHVENEEYVKQADPLTPLEFLRKRLADIDGFDWHLMPWTLTGKDYPIGDIRRMAIDSDVD